MLYVPDITFFRTMVFYLCLPYMLGLIYDYFSCKTFTHTQKKILQEYGILQELRFLNQFSDNSEHKRVLPPIIFFSLLTFLAR